MTSDRTRQSAPNTLSTGIKLSISHHMACGGGGIEPRTARESVVTSDCKHRSAPTRYAPNTHPMRTRYKHAWALAGSTVLGNKQGVSHDARATVASRQITCVRNRSCRTTDMPCHHRPPLHTHTHTYTQASLVQK